ncbi:hypothetical protein O3Q52_00765 [Streptomyces sp. ActVer]|uniref:hypothetical protein n=1 Tax=Streptomyces sp. ActVer TaxID=3014558 RepID=UPI0022B5880A|nr:hypothetical protein [Streptomyces sp. ActVer]MCZ4506761.1 hypothetical protein [Streptomyces sp. ActVer]
MRLYQAIYDVLEGQVELLVGVTRAGRWLVVGRLQERRQNAVIGTTTCAVRVTAIGLEMSEMGSGW